MIYYKEMNDYVYKYDVEYDEEEVRKLRREIINKCSLIEHKEYESDYEPHYTNATILNFNRKFTGKSIDYNEEERPVYNFSFDKYNHPYLVKLIDKLLNGDNSSINEILEYNPSDEVAIDDKIGSLKDFIKSTDLNDAKLVKSKIEELDTLSNLRKANEDRVSTDTYYKKLLNLIHPNLLGAIKKEDLEKSIKFLELDGDYNNINKKYIKK